MKKHDINQLELDFNASRDELKAAVDKFGQSAEALAKAVTDSPEEHDQVGDQMKDLRATINRLVGILADQSGLPFHAVWVLAYHELNAATGFHAVVESGGKGKHLDAVQQAGKLPDLQDTVVGMMKDKKYQPGETKR